MERTTNRPDHHDPSTPARAAHRPLMAVLLVALTSIQGGALHAQTELIPLGATWRYLDDGVSPSSQGETTWIKTGYDDSSPWASGPAPLGYGDTGRHDSGTTVSYGNDPDNKYTTTYFRHTFTVSDISGITELDLGLVRDDGAVVYLNGQEISRSNMDAGSVTYSTFASDAVSDPNETAVFTTTIPSTLVAGTNVVAVEIHQNQSGSSDLNFDLRLQVPPPPPDTLVPLKATWTYLDNGSDQGTTWTAPTFDDDGWSFGPAQLGYGENGETTTISYGTDPDNKHITSYFRHTFTVPDADAITGLEVALLRDDGGVVYLNGTEVFRSNMPGGAIDYTTLAATNVSEGDETALFESYISPTLLVTGDNVIAVEIHQDAPTSSDVSFDLRLIEVPAVTPALERGPYLQRGGTNQMTICWRTNVPTESVVSYGTSADSLNQEVSSLTFTTNHAVTIPILSTDTTYFYSVGTPSTVLASGSEYYFDTHPAVASSGPTRLWVLGDSGTADGNARDVRDAFEAVNGSAHTDLVLMLGDNAYNSGTDTEYQAAVFEMYPDTLRNTVLWPTLGNHDAYTAESATQSGVYYDIFELPTAAEAGGVASGTEAYYSFDYANIHFVCLDSDDSDRTLSGDMADWLVQDLSVTEQEFIVAFWHHPPYTDGSHESDDPTDSGGRMKDMREIFVPIFEDYGVDLVLCGHSHSYERSMLIDGHYELSTEFDQVEHARDATNGDPDGDGLFQNAYQKTAAPNQGAVYAVAGSSGKTSGGSLNHPVMVTSQDTLGSMIIDVTGTTLTARFITSSGTQTDTFTIEHVNGTNQAPVLVNNSLSVEDGMQVTLTSSDLSATDPDSQEGTLRFTVSSVTNGEFQVSSIQVTEFTQDQVTAGAVVFVPDGSGTTPTYSVTVSDGETSVGPQAATINFTTGGDPYDGDIWPPALEFLFGFDDNVFDAVCPVTFGTETIGTDVFVTYTFRRRDNLAGLYPEPVVSFSSQPGSEFSTVTATGSTTPVDGFRTDTYRDDVPVNADGALTPRFGKISIAGEETETFATIPIAIKEDTDTNETPITRFGAGLIGIKVAEGTATAVGAFTLTDENALFGDLASGQFYVLMTSGTNEGARAAISTNTNTNTKLTLAADLSSLEIVGQQYEIRQYLTIGDLFGPANEAGLLAGTNSSTADNLLLTRTGIETFFYSSSPDIGWKDSGALDATDEPIDPLVPLAIRRRGTTGGLTVYPSGAVPRTGIATTLVSGNNFLALPNSIPVTPGELGLDNLVQRGANPVTADNLLVFQADGSVARYFFVQFETYTGWYDSSYAAAVEIPAGSAIVFQRRGTTPIQWNIPSPTPPPAP